MIKITDVTTYGFETAIRGMRNPMNSWDKSDSEFVPWDITSFEIGENDLDLMKRLFKGGTEHRKYLRMINVTMDITCHHTWWAEFDTYKIGTVRNSCSKMHKIHVKEFVKDDFSTEGIDECGGRTLEVFEIVKDELERLRRLFNETHEKKYWRAIIELLPMGYNIRATVQMNYEVAVNIIRQRKNHKLDEWHVMVDELLNLPYMKEIMGVDYEIN
jgi:hypothetical protein